jgi:nucleoside phosphorylase
MVGNPDMNGSEELEYNIEQQEWYTPNLPETQEIAEDRWASLQKEIDVVIITATEAELKAVGRLLRPYPRSRKVLLVYSESETYYLGKFGEYKTVVTKCDMGAIGRGAAINATRTAIDLWSPKAVIMVGIAFGKDSKKQRIGDVLVASEIISYEQQKLEDGGKITHRGNIPPSNKTLLNRFKNPQNWEFPLPDGSSSKLIYGAILSGEKLFKNKQSKDDLFDYYSQAVGGEMEGAGLYAAADSKNTAWILVKSICDWGDETKHDMYQPLAAAAATSLVHHVLSQKTALNELSEKKN